MKSTIPLNLQIRNLLDHVVVGLYRKVTRHKIDVWRAVIEPRQMFAYRLHGYVDLLGGLCVHCNSHQDQ